MIHTRRDSDRAEYRRCTNSDPKMGDTGRKLLKWEANTTQPCMSRRGPRGKRSRGPNSHLPLADTALGGTSTLATRTMRRIRRELLVSWSQIGYLFSCPETSVARGAAANSPQ